MINREIGILPIGGLPSACVAQLSHWTQSGTVASLKGEGSDWCSQLKALFVSRFTTIGQFRVAVVSGRQKSTVNCPLVDGLSEKQKIQIHSAPVQLLKLLCEKAENYRPRMTKHM
ncbi:hypothetical protein T03_9969 [Trichinella britovi]|uniref:Uncharacterized protein n=1 Tax=Trichinella britovi TaxID=45882 RepID=A0A0V1DD88_TRIBR|nr:hypothetical protein T03_9969 [Trichinella britovi]